MTTEGRYRAFDSLRAKGKIRKLTCGSIFACTLVVLSACGEPARPAIVSVASSSTRSAPAIADSSAESALARDTSQKPMAYVARPDTLRGLYVNRWAAIGNRMWELIALARRTEVNALVIDVKDDRGLVLYRSRVPLVRAIGGVRRGAGPGADQGRLR